jgi:hypothetical protein
VDLNEESLMLFPWKMNRLCSSPINLFTKPQPPSSAKSTTVALARNCCSTHLSLLFLHWPQLTTWYWYRSRHRFHPNSWKDKGHHCAMLERMPLIRGKGSSGKRSKQRIETASFVDLSRAESVG